ncbi:hypothetical protein ABBQ32_005811 [Trebouxia sp. C0010 RCD-2024]
MSGALEDRRPSGAVNMQPTKSLPVVETAADAFDKDDFDPLRYINEMFPSEASLVGLDPLIGSLKHRIRRVDTEILGAVRQQSSSGTRAKQDLDKSKMEIQELFGKINEIRRKAEQSEVMVQEICRDIKKLDYAKKHLTYTITALRRLAMLINAVDQLQRAVERHEYAEAAHLVEAVQQLSMHFQSFAQIPKVAELAGRVATLQRSLHMNVMREFELLGTGEESTNPLLLERLKACCLVTDALGYKARDELVDYVCKKEMGVYSQIFTPVGDTAQLDRVERRYNWLRKRLKGREEVWAIFPEAWRLPQLLCLMFCQVTKSQVAEILDSRGAELVNNVEALLLAVKSTNDFEAEMARRFGGSVSEDTEHEEDEAMDGMAADDASPASAVRERYERMFKEKQRGGSKGLAGGALSGDPAAAALAAQGQAVRTAFQGSISSVFTKHLSVYVDAEEKQLRETMDGLVKQESWQPMEDAQQTNVLKSSSELFAVIKRSLTRCSKFVSTGAAMLQLCNAFQRVLRAYAGKLIGRLPKTASGSVNATAAAGTTEWQIKMPDDDIPVVCTIVSTAEYCNEIVGSLGRSVAKMLDPPFGEQVDVSEEEDQFQAVTTACLNVLILAVETRLDVALQQMTRMPWATLETVGDQSEFVNVFSKVVGQVGPRIGAALTTNYFRFFCDKLANSFTPRFYEYIFRCRKIGEAGSQQLLLDTQAIKALLLELPSAGKSKGEEGAAGPAGFSSWISRELGRAEALLKVVGSRPDTLAVNFFTLMPSGTLPDYQRIIDLKAMKRSEQQQCIDAFNKRVGRPAPTPVQFPRPPPQQAQAPAGAAPRAAAGDGQHPSTSTAVASGVAPASSLPAGPGPSSAAMPGRSEATEEQLRASTQTQELANRFKFGANDAAARASAASINVSERMKEGMAGSLAAMKRLNLGFKRSSQQESG